MALVPGVVTAVVAAAGLVALTAPAAAAAPPGVSPVVQRSAAAVTADALPTVQINGVVWTQAVVGNNVYAGGSFTSARPAGSPAGSNETPRGNLLSYNLSTGVLNAAFAPSLNAQVQAITASPDGSVIYVGGDFTQANGVARSRIAAYSTATGQLISTFAPTLNSEVNSITVTATTVYVGGFFTTANGNSRLRLAAFNAANGALLPWAPSADDLVQALVLTPDHSRVIVGGQFENVNGLPAYGLASVDATTGTLLPWAASNVVRDAGTGASILSLSTDGTYIYSTSYVYTNTGNFEGVLSADPDTGAINWLADCHGDTYGAFGVNGAVYVVSHEHFCGNIGGFPDTNPRTAYYRSTAFTAAATGTVKKNSETGNGYGNFAGQPSPSLVNWIPSIDIGTYTGQNQGAWSVTGNTQYVVEGGEFLHVNGVAQQGLVRFAVPSLAPNKQGPQVSGADVTATATAQSSTSVNLTWQTNWDRDDQHLTYTIYRQDQTTTPVYTVAADSQFWNRPTLSDVVTGLLPGTTYSFRVAASDPSGNVAYGNYASVTTQGVAANQPPVPAFSTTATGLSVAFDGSASTDPNGTINSYAWTFGDGATGTGVKPTHTYATAGSYQVTLTATDNKTAQASVTKTVVVSSTSSVLASDSFGRSVSSGWGSADAGGAWTLSGGASAFSVNGTQGLVNLAAPVTYPTALLNGVSATNINMVVDVGISSIPTGNGLTVLLAGHRTSNSDYRLMLRVLPGGVVHLAWSKVVAGKAGAVNEMNVSGLTYNVGDVLRLRYQLVGNANGTTTLTGKVWKVGTTEPSAAQLTATDSEPSLQAPGAVGIQSSLGSTVTNAPIVVTYDNLLVTSS